MKETIGEIIDRAEDLLVKWGNRLIDLEEMIAETADSKKEALLAQYNDLSAKRQELTQKVASWREGNYTIAELERYVDQMASLFTSGFDTAIRMAKKFLP